MAESDAGRTVMIAMDGSKHSIYAFEWYLVNFYKKTDKVIFSYCAEFGVTMPPTALMSWSPVNIEEMVKHSEQEVNSVLKTIEALVSKHNIPHVLERVTGTPGEGLIKAAEKHKVDLIVAGSRGLGTIRRTILGSVSDYLVHHSHVPVLICKHEDEHVKLK